MGQRFQKGALGSENSTIALSVFLHPGPHGLRLFLIIAEVEAAAAVAPKLV
jgi:hypothetical protein